MKIFLHAIIIASLLFQTIEAAAIRGKVRLRKKEAFPRETHTLIIHSVPISDFKTGVYKENSRTLN